MSKINERPLNETELEAFEYLNDLRDSGVVNMFESTPYLQRDLGLSKTESIKYLTSWMKNFREDGDYTSLRISDE